MQGAAISSGFAWILKHTLRPIHCRANALLATITETLTAGDTGAIPFLGTFEVREHAARQGRNPATGEALITAAKKAPVFKPAKALTDVVE